MEKDKVRFVLRAIEAVKAFDGDRYYALAYDIAVLTEYFSTFEGPLWDELTAALKSNKLISDDPELQSYIAADFIAEKNPPWWPF